MIRILVRIKRLLFFLDKESAQNYGRALSNTLGRVISANIDIRWKSRGIIVYMKSPRETK